MLSDLKIPISYKLYFISEGRVRSVFIRKFPLRNQCSTSLSYHSTSVKLLQNFVMKYENNHFHSIHVPILLTGYSPNKFLSCSVTTSTELKLHMFIKLLLNFALNLCLHFPSSSILLTDSEPRVCIAYVKAFPKY